ncbi:hypothetical protein ONZ51_g12 [Trametes cubensis]|uniref:Uncharacterized protein n=1 Tax=Trametes cubensis TaxID=1111947 RepID=A0AAD7XG47_9APHY|nr:hypothetical protein ONZ51_g12 [Trametes cubensis]
MFSTDLVDLRESRTPASSAHPRASPLLALAPGESSLARRAARAAHLAASPVADLEPRSPRRRPPDTLYGFGISTVVPTTSSAGDQQARTSSASYNRSTERRDHDRRPLPLSSSLDLLVFESGDDLHRPYLDASHASAQNAADRRRNTTIHFNSHTSVHANARYRSKPE